MIQIKQLDDVLMTDYPVEARDVIKTFATILDENYGTERDPIAD